MSAAEETINKLGEICNEHKIEELYKELPRIYLKGLLQGVFVAWGSMLITAIFILAIIVLT